MEAYNFIEPNCDLAAEDLVEHFRICIRKLVMFEYQLGRSQVALNNREHPDLKIWVRVLSFMTRKLCALYLGQTDYDFRIQDLYFYAKTKRENDYECSK